MGNPHFWLLLACGSFESADPIFKKVFLLQGCGMKMKTNPYPWGYQRCDAEQKGKSDLGHWSKTDPDGDLVQEMYSAFIFNSINFGSNRELY